LGVTPATANRRYHEWTADGSWVRFWDALMALRNPDRRRDAARSPRHRASDASASRYPVPVIAEELIRAYRFFNAEFFGGSLPDRAAITVQVPRRGQAGEAGYFCGERWRKEANIIDHIFINT
jgi:hypothetical protein